METPVTPPGPAADDAFSLGLAMGSGAFVAGVVLLSWGRVLSPTAGLLAVVLGLPVVVVVVSCLLGVWLGYHEDALARVVEASKRAHDTPE